MYGENTHILLATEAEAYVQSIDAIGLKEIGSSQWNLQHERLEQLNMQAAVSASAQQDEFIKEYLVTYEKIPVLIQELITTEVWKQKVFPEFLGLGLEQTVMFPVYMVLYHEVTVANLLETVMYHGETCEAAEDSILDLLDYCYHKLSAHINRPHEDEDEEEEIEVQSTQGALAQVNSLQELQKQNTTLDFEICLKAITLLRYVTDHMTKLSLSVMNRLLNTHDVPLLLVQLVETPPWTRERKGQLQKHIEGRWQDVADTDRFKLTKLEGQVWIALFQVLMGEDCQRKYELNTHRKNIILRLRSHLTTVLLDQMPILGEVQRYLEQLAVMDPPASKRDLVLEQVPEIREHILRENEGKWDKIARHQSHTFFNPSKVDMKAQARRLAETYNFDVLESMITEPPKCAMCGAEACKRCSRCQNEWYCRRECQVKHWKKHKKACNLLVDSLEKIKKNSTQEGLTAS